MHRDKMRYNDLPRKAAQVVASNCALALDGCAGAMNFFCLQASGSAPINTCLRSRR